VNVKKPARRNETPAANALFATALASGYGVREAARIAGLKERTAYRRLGERGTRRELALKKAELCEVAAARLRVATLKAITTVEELLDDKDARVRLAAAKAAVTMAKELGEEATRHALEARNMMSHNEPPIDVDALEVEMVGMETVEDALARNRLTTAMLAEMAGTPPQTPAAIGGA
jgi:HEAT repeat protein